MKQIILAAVLLAAGAAMAGQGGNPQPDRSSKSPAFATIQEDPALPRVLLIGDSISVDYTLIVRKALQGKANVLRIPENGGPTSRGVVAIDKWLGDRKWDVIHFNWGLHDVKYVDGKNQVLIDDYEKNLRELVKKLKATGATLIWASTTPVPEGNLNPPRKSIDVVEYNARAQKIMDEEKVTINNLYGVALERLKDLQIPVNVHFKANGSEVLGSKAAEAITAALEKRAGKK